MQLNYLVWMLLALQWIFSVTTTGHVPSPSCCTKTSTNQVRVKEIVEYIHQNKPLCPIKAVRFLLKSGNNICSDPEDTWAKHVIKEMDKRKTTKLPNSGKEFTTGRSSPEPSTEGTITMTTPKGTSTTWKSGTSITRGSLQKQKPGITNKPSQTTTTTQITPIKMTTSTVTTTIATEETPSTTDIKTTSTSMTTESPVAMTATTLRPRTTVTHHSTEQSTKEQITTFKVTTMKSTPLTTITKAMSKTMTTERQMTTSLSTRTATTWKSTSNTVKQVTPETKTSSMTKGKRMTITASRGTSTTESPVQKSSTRNFKPHSTSCRPAMSSLTTEKKKLPWTVRRLRKKTKTGLRRAQMNIKPENKC